MLSQTSKMVKINVEKSGSRLILRRSSAKKRQEFFKRSPRVPKTDLFEPIFEKRMKKSYLLLRLFNHNF